MIVRTFNIDIITLLIDIALSWMDMECVIGILSEMKDAEW